MKHPSIVCYRSSDDLLEVKKWFYEFSDTEDHRLRAIKRVRAFSTRGKIPHGLESTALLTSVCLQDIGDSSSDTNVLRLSYAMALIRFVNGLLDPLQQSNYAIPLHTLAKTLSLPSFFVELRHMGTHELLPSLQMLRIACSRALTWLYDNYWSGIQERTPVKEVTEVREETANKEHQEKLLNSLKTYKSIRKENLDMVYKYGNSSENGVKYWAAIKQIKLARLESVANALVEGNYLFPKKTKKPNFNPLLVKLYRPLLEELHVETNTGILFSIFQHKTKLSLAPQHIKEWCAVIIRLIVDSKAIELAELCENLIAAAQCLGPQTRYEFLSCCHEIFVEIDLPPQFLQQIKKEMDSAKQKAQLARYAAPTLEDILGDGNELQIEETPLTKKRKTSSKLLEPIANWTPTPFGICK